MSSLQDMQNNAEIQRTVMKAQEKILTQYRKRLTPKLQKELQAYVSTGKQVGSSEFFKLSPVLREIVVKMYVSNIDIMMQSTKNPLKKLQLWIAKAATKKLAVVEPKKKKKKKK